MRLKLLCSGGMATSKSLTDKNQIMTYPCQYAGVHSHNLRQTFHGFCPNSNSTFPKDTQDLLKQYTFFFPKMDKSMTYYISCNNMLFYLI